MEYFGKILKNSEIVKNAKYSDTLIDRMALNTHECIVGPGSYIYK